MRLFTPVMRAAARLRWVALPLLRSAGAGARRCFRRLRPRVGRTVEQHPVCSAPLPATDHSSNNIKPTAAHTRTRHACKRAIQSVHCISITRRQHRITSKPTLSIQCPPSDGFLAATTAASGALLQVLTLLARPMAVHEQRAPSAHRRWLAGVTPANPALHDVKLRRRT